MTGLFRRTAALALAIPLLAGCSEHADPLSTGAPDGSPELLAELTCVADLTASTLECGVPSGAGSASLIVGGQDVYVRLASTNLVRASDTLSVDVTVQNLIPQALGTTDGTSLDPAGVRVFFHSGPTVTEGAGAVSVANPDGLATYTASGQPYFQYDEVLDTDEVSAARSWRMAVDAGVSKFVFTVFVAAEVQYPDGWVDVTGSAGTMGTGDVDSLAAAVVDVVGNPVPGAGVTWQSSDTTVATVDANGVVTAVGSGPVTISATAGARSGSAAVTVCYDLAVGETVAIDLALASSLCFAGGSSGADYTYMPLNLSASSPLSLGVTGTGIAAVSGSPSPNLAPLRDGALASLSVDGGSRDAHLADRERQRREATALLGRSGSRIASPAGGARFTITTGVPTVGDLMDLNVARSCSGSLDTRTGQVRSVGTYAVAMADTANPAGGFTTAQYDSIVAEFDSIAWPSVTDNFGAPADVDGNGRVVLFFTRAVNELFSASSSDTIRALFENRDLQSSSTCNLSNEGEILYMMVPDPTGVVNGNVRTVSHVREHVVRMAGHELQHLVNASRRLYVTGASSLEETWLDESMSGAAEELMFYRTSFGLAPRGNINLSTLTSGSFASRRVAAFNAYAHHNYVRLRGWLQRPDTTAALDTASAESNAQRGAGWAFLRYAADRVGGTESDFWSSLVDAGLTGTANLQNAVGADPNEWLRDFSMAMYADDAVSGISSEYMQPSWNFRSVYGGLGSVPHGVRQLSEGATVTLSYSQGGGTAFFRFGVPASTFATVTADAGTATDELIVMRTR